MTPPPRPDVDIEEGTITWTMQGRNALVTGASRGLGVHTARALAREGVNLILVARSAADLETVLEEMESLGVDAIALPADLADASRVESLAGEAERALGGADTS